MPPEEAACGLLSTTIATADCWLTSRRVHLYCTAILLASFLSVAATVLLGDPPFDAYGQPIAQDFVAQTTAGRIARSGRIRELYNPMAQRQVQQAILGSGHETYLNLFLMPPFAAFLYAPFARLPYLVAVGLWTGLSVALIGAACVALRPLAPRLGRIGLGSLLLVAFSSAPVIELLGAGQDASLSLAIVVGGLRLLTDGRDLSGGVVLALGLFKPQLFVLSPVLLFAEQRWRALAAWTAMALGLAAVSLALVGADGVRSHRALLESDLYRQGISEGLRWKMQSLPALAGYLLPPVFRPRAPGLLYDAVPVAAAALLLIIALRRNRRLRRAPQSITLPFALTVLIGACANPHFLLYDATVLLLPAWILLGAADDDPGLRVGLLLLYLLLWTAPLRHFLTGNLPWPLCLPGAPWAAVMIAWLALEATRLLDAERAGRGMASQ